MPMFFFHTKTIDGVIEEDTVGAPFDSKDEAIREAEDYVRGVMQDAVNGSETVEHFIEVTDEQGNTIVKLDCKTTIVRERVTAPHSFNLVRCHQWAPPELSNDTDRPNDSRASSLAWCGCGLTTCWVLTPI
jgi:hypothetical protein